MKNCLTVILAFITFSISAQNNTDSLLKVISNSKNDSTISNAYNKLATKLQRIDIEKSKQYSEKAYNIATTKNIKSEILTAQINLGGSYLNEGNYLKALDYFFDALKSPIVEEKKQSGLLYSNIGSTFYRKGDLTEALKYYDKAIEKFKQHQDTLNIGKTGLNIGNIEHALKKNDKAIKSINRALEIFKKFNYLSGEISSYVNLGVIYNDKNKYNKAIEYFKIAEQIAQKLNSEYIKAAVYINLGTSYLGLEKLDIAQYYLEDAYAISNKLKVLDIKKEATQKLSELYAVQHYYEKAYLMQKSFKEISDSLVNKTNTKRITELEMSYQFEKQQKEQQLIQEKKEIEQKKQLQLTLVLLISVLGAFVTVSLFAIYINKSKKRLSVFNTKLQDANSEITQQKEKLAISHKQITDSISYASRIQIAMLPDKEDLNSFEFEHFIYYKPRDVVSGDFYLIKSIKHIKLLIVADCTGHGVPGAFMSMLGIAFINELIRKEEIIHPNKLLEELRKNVKQALWKSETDYQQSDGMDIAVCIFNEQEKHIEYAGANISLYYIRNKTLNFIEHTRNPIGNYPKEIPFKNNKMDYLENDQLYLFTDGYRDQLGGNENKRIGKKRFKQLLLDNHQKTMEMQRKYLESFMNNWFSSKQSQVDDILVIGVRMKNRIN